MNASSGLRIVGVLAAVAALALGSSAAWAAEASPPASPTPVAPTPAPAVAPAPPPPPAKQTTGIACLDELDDFFDKTKNPFPWMTWGADVRFRNEYVAHRSLNENAANRGLGGKYLDYQRTRLRWWTTMTPAKDIDFNLRFEAEPRHFSDPNGTPTWNEEQAWIDSANLKLTRVGGSPLTMTLGRQDIFLGDGWLVGDGTPIDGSRTFFFDAARFTYEAAPIQTTFDLMYVQQDHRGDAMLPPLLSFKQNVVEQDERGLILWATNRSVKNTEINGYYMYKDEDRVRGIANSDQAYIDTMGGRVKADLDDHWQARFEGAHQFGEKNGRNLRAFGANSQLAYFFRDPMKNQVRLFYEYASGDDPTSEGTDEGFDPLWGRWPRWTELYTIFVVPATGEGVTGETTNLHRFGPGWAFQPHERVECSLDYNILFAATDSTARRGAGGTRPAAFGGGLFRGHDLSFVVGITLTRHLKAKFINEAFFPGSFYSDSRQEVAFFSRGELYFTW